MYGLSLMFQDTASPQQQDFSLWGVPGGTIQVFVDGKQTPDFTVSGSTLSLTAPLEEGTPVAAQL